MVLSRSVAPRVIVTDDLEIRSVLARRAINALLALPFSGAAVTETFRIFSPSGPVAQPRISFFAAFGVRRIVIVVSVTYIQSHIQNRGAVGQGADGD